MKKEYVEELCPYMNNVWKEAKTNQLLILIFLTYWTVPFV